MMESLPFTGPSSSYGVTSGGRSYELSMADDLDPEYYSEQFREFKRTFLVLHKLIKLPWTLKVLKICLWTLNMKSIIGSYCW